MDPGTSRIGLCCIVWSALPLEKDQQALQRLEQYIKELLDSKSKFELQSEQVNIQSQELAKAKILFDKEQLDLETAQLSFNQQQSTHQYPVVWHPTYHQLKLHRLRDLYRRIISIDSGVSR